MAIVTPIWRAELTLDEETFVRATERTNPDTDRWFVAPQTLDLTWYQERFPSWRVRTFAAEHFRSVHAYSLWLTAPDLYLKFADYEFLTIVQTDAVLVRSLGQLQMVDVDQTPIDYVGAPWEPAVKVLRVGRRIYVATDFDRPEGLRITRWLGRSLTVGNGGLTTRRTSTLIDVTRYLTSRFSEAIRMHTLEDVLLCAVGPDRGMRIASRPRAQQIYQETQVVGATELPDVFGFHALHRWNPVLAAQIADGSR